MERANANRKPMSAPSILQSKSKSESEDQRLPASAMSVVFNQIAVNFADERFRSMFADLVKLSPTYEAKGRKMLKDLIRAKRIPLLDHWASCSEYLGFLRVRDHSDPASLFRAIEKSRTSQEELDDIRYWLIGNRDKINQTMDFGNSETTPMGYAAFANSPQLVEILLKLGANPNVKCCSSETPTPLWQFFDNGDLSTIKLLLKHGADPKLHGLKKWVNDIYNEPEEWRGPARAYASYSLPRWYSANDGRATLRKFVYLFNQK